jgi:hypothetical protein
VGNSPEQSSGDDGHRKPVHDGGMAALAQFKGWNEWVLSNGCGVASSSPTWDHSGPELHRAVVRQSELVAE